VPDRVLYLFDGSNILHAGGFDDRERLVDVLAGHVAMRGAQGVVVFDGVGEARTVDALEVRFAPHADDVIERLAVESRDVDQVVVVSSDRTVRTTAGYRVAHRSAQNFLRELTGEEAGDAPPSAPGSKVEDALDPATRAKLERWRRRHA